jgi:hypothetical protein
MGGREGLVSEATRWSDEMTSRWKGRKEEATREGERGERLLAGCGVQVHFLSRSVKK